jgi:hypothetical protein
VFSLPVRSQTDDVTVRLASVNPDQLAIEKEFQSPIFARSVSVAVTDLGSLHLLFHRGYSLEERWFVVNTSAQIFSETSFVPIAWTIALGTKVAGGAEVMPRSSWHDSCYGAPPSVSLSVSRIYARRGPIARPMPRICCLEIFSRRFRCRYRSPFRRMGRSRRPSR